MNPLSDIGRFMIVAGLVIAGVGLLLSLAGKFPGIGRLPGDILIKRDNFSFYFPITTCLLISLVLSLLFWFLNRR